MKKDLSPGVVATVIIIVLAIFAGVLWKLTTGPKPRTLSMGQMRGSWQTKMGKPTGASASTNGTSATTPSPSKK